MIKIKEGVKMATVKKNALGKGLRQLGGGLDSVIPTNPDIEKDKKEKNLAEIYINIDLIEPNKEQPREYFDEESINELAESIKQYGVLQPLLLKKNGKTYNIIAGERRWRAAKIAGLKEVPAITKEYTEEQTLAIAIIENIQREDLNPIEEAKAYSRLIEEFNITQEDLSKKISKSRTSITNSLRLLKLDERIQNMVISKQISNGHARSLISVEDKDLQYQLASQIIDKDLTVREIEAVVKNLKNKEKEDNKEKDKTKKKDDSFIYKDLAHEIELILGSKVNIRKKTNNKGKIEIDYYSIEELERIIDLLNTIG